MRMRQWRLGQRQQGMELVQVGTDCTVRYGVREWGIVNWKVGYENGTIGYGIGKQGIGMGQQRIKMEDWVKEWNSGAQSQVLEMQAQVQ